MTPTTAALTVPHAAARGATQVPRLAAAVCAVLAACCVPLALVGLLVGQVAVALVGGVGLLFWAGLAALAWRAARRAAGQPLVGGSVIAAARPDGVQVGPGAVLPWAAVESVSLHWFGFGSRAAVQGPGGAVGAALIEAAYAGAGGDLGLALCLYPREPSWLGIVPARTPLPLSVATDPAGRSAVVVKGHRLLTDGDPTAFATAVVTEAARHGVRVDAPPAPPPGPLPLPPWLA